MAQKIVDFEARRDQQGHLQVYKLPKDDGGGDFEVAGINERYHPDDAKHLAKLVEAGRYREAEELACEIVASLTDHVEKWTSMVAVESYLRDCSFNRGPGGAARILQDAVGVAIDGRVGDRTLAEVREREQDPRQLLLDLRAARERYERRAAGRDETSHFWRGLVSRWNKALEFAMTFLPSGEFRAAAATTKMLEGNGGGVVDVVEPAAPDLYAGKAADPVVEAADGDALGVPVAIPPQTPIVLRALRQGARGALVRAWQSFLLGQKLDPGGLDGDFGDKTVAATMAFQEREGLAADGVAGRQTLMRAMALGFELIEEPAADKTGSNYPPRPDFPPLTGTAARQSVFGAFQFVAAPVEGNRERIRILGDWEQKNIVMVPVPQLRAALGPKAPSGMQFHRLAAKQLQGLWQDWENASLLDRIISFDGSFVPRFIRGSTTNLSNHSFGSAFDINASHNRLGTRPALVGELGSTRELVPLANKWGFYWGGHFGTRPDGMHFEVAFLTSAAT
jgi:peptidoglycan hydrolase-like protein with peptidoglycan-binding domain